MEMRNIEQLLVLIGLFVYKVDILSEVNVVFKNYGLELFYGDCILVKKKIGQQFVILKQNIYVSLMFGKLFFKMLKLC